MQALGRSSVVDQAADGSVTITVGDAELMKLADDLNADKAAIETIAEAHKDWIESSMQKVVGSAMQDQELGMAGKAFGERWGPEIDRMGQRLGNIAEEVAMANPQLAPGGGRDPAVKEMESEFDGPMGDMGDATAEMAGDAPAPALGDYANDEVADNFYEEGMPVDQMADAAAVPVPQ